MVMTNEETSEDEQHASSADSKEDNVYNYHKLKLSYRLFLHDFVDAIKEGDGLRLISLYKLALLMFSSHGHTKYAYVPLL